MAAARAAIEAMVRTELGTPVPAAARAAGEEARRRFGDGVAAVLFHGSCLRDGTVEDRILDLYLLADHPRAVRQSALARIAGAILPPNVYYLETAFEGRPVRAKCALVPLAAFVRRTRGSAFHPYFWARFAQPCALLWVRDDDSRRGIVDALVTAATTLIEETLPLFRERPDAAALWTRAFAETYRTELRSEGAGRAAELYAAAAARYDRIAGLVLAELPPPSDADRRRARRRWLGRRLAGKPLSVLRLLKAAFTFEGGADYLMWKISRHAGVRVELSPWQRRHPILASTVEFWRLYRRGGFR